MLKKSVAFLTTYFIPQRHAIIHGRSTSYGKAKLSIQVLLIVFILANEVRAFEESGTASSPFVYQLALDDT